MEINLDFSSAWQNILAFINQDPVSMAWQLFLHGGWVVFLFLASSQLYSVWLDGRRKIFASKWEYVLLAIDIPKDNEQTPKAVENIFAGLVGAYSGGNLIDKYWSGKVQESFSFEVVSLEGYVQFLVRAPKHFRDLIEASVYAQYPEAQITEVEDYASLQQAVKFPDEQFNLWGTEFVLVRDYPYPIRTYPEFEHLATQTFIDPMAGLLEIMTRFGPGEQIWLQLVVKPLPPGWGEKAKEIIQKFKGEKYEPPTPWSVTVANKPVEWLGKGVDTISASFGILPAEEVKKEEKAKGLSSLSPGEKLVLDNVSRKLSRHAFEVAFRLVYFGEKPVFNKGRGVAAIIGAIQQFNSTDGNGFKPGKKSKTGADYFKVAKRIALKQNNILQNYISRSGGEDTPDNMLMSAEELATLWHFPVLTVKAPTVEKAGSRRVAAPSRLPVGNRDFILEKNRPLPSAREEAKRGSLMPEDFANPHRPSVEPMAPPSAPVPDDLPEMPMDRTPVVSESVNDQQIDSRPAGQTATADSRRGVPPPNLPIA